MTEPLRVLLVEDSATDAKLVVQELKRTGRRIEFERVETADAMSKALDEKAWDLVISDWSLPRFSGPAALAVLKEKNLDLPFIIVSGTVGEDRAVEAMRAGARDYVLKDKLGRLAPAVERELHEYQERLARRQAEHALRESEARLRDSEEQLRHAQKMEAVGRLAGGVAHDFNNLLSVVLSYCSFMSDDLAANDPMREDLDQIRRAGERAADLTRQLLAFSRQQVIEPRILDLSTVISGMEKMLRRLVGEDVEVQFSHAPGLGRVKADPGHLEQVIMNLVVNARDAMPIGGRLVIETANVVLDESYAQQRFDVAGPHVMLAVSDTGNGMDKETQLRIFEPFFTTKEKGKGTGLGLSTVFGIVKQSGGTIWVYSEIGKGTTFKVYLPHTDEVARAPRHTAELATLRGGETILLVEDDDQVRLVARGILKRNGYRVLEARNGGEALLMCEKHAGEIDLLLTDVVMPQMSGTELAARLLLIRPDLKVLYMSGYTEDAIIHHGVVDAGIELLQKPLTPDTLLRKVRGVLDRHR